jgi:hypothetical protein
MPRDRPFDGVAVCADRALKSPIAAVAEPDLQLATQERDTRRENQQQETDKPRIERGDRRHRSGIHRSGR